MRPVEESIEEGGFADVAAAKECYFRGGGGREFAELRGPEEELGGLRGEEGVGVV